MCLNDKTTLTLLTRHLKNIRQHSIYTSTATIDKRNVSVASHTPYSIMIKKKINKLKKIRIHREGTDTLLYGFIALAAIALLLWRYEETHVAFWCFTVIMGIVYAIVINFFRCPVRYFPTEDTEKIVVAPADGRVVVIEEVDEDTYFHDRRIMVSIFMSLFNVHANWFPVDGKVKKVAHHNGNFHKAWLPKASEENEHADVVITTPEGTDILCRQIAGAGSPHRYLCKGRRRLLHRRAHGIHQVRITRRCVSAVRHRSVRKDGADHHWRSNDNRQAEIIGIATH